MFPLHKELCDDMLGSIQTVRIHVTTCNLIREISFSALSEATESESHHAASY